MMWKINRDITFNGESVIFRSELSYLVFRFHPRNHRNTKVGMSIDGCIHRPKVKALSLFVFMLTNIYYIHQGESLIISNKFEIDD